MTEQNKTLECLTNSIETCIHQAEFLGLTETTGLLQMVKLDIAMRSNGITEDELDHFLFALECELRIEEHISPLELATKLSNQKFPNNSEM